MLSNETAKRKSVLKAGEDAVLEDVMDLSDPSEVKKLAALVPMMKSADGGMHDFCCPYNHTVSCASVAPATETPVECTADESRSVSLSHALSLSVTLCLSASECVQ